jgi:hypothetical protein
MVEKYLSNRHLCMCFTYNKRDKIRSKVQYGGKAILSYGLMSHYAMGRGEDKAKLGQWLWARYQGKNAQVLCVVSIYCTCAPSTNGEHTVWAQHKEYLQLINDNRDPRQAWLEDFEDELALWMEAGDHIVIGGNVNEDIFHEDITSLFK